MALAAAALSQDGKQPSPQLSIAFNDHQNGWRRLQVPAEAVQVLPPGMPQQAAESMAVSDMPFWQSLSLAPDPGGQNLTWYLGGTVPEWTGSPFALAVLF
jgi:hypothetical protein